MDMLVPSFVEVCLTETIVDVGAHGTDDDIRGWHVMLGQNFSDFFQRSTGCHAEDELVSSVFQKLSQFIQTFVIFRLTDQCAVNVGDQHFLGGCQSFLGSGVFGHLLVAAFLGVFHC